MLSLKQIKTNHESVYTETDSEIFKQIISNVGKLTDVYKKHHSKSPFNCVIEFTDKSKKKWLFNIKKDGTFSITKNNNRSCITYPVFRKMCK